MPDEVATVAEEVKTIPAQDTAEAIPETGVPLPGEPGSIYTNTGDIAHGLPMKQVAETKLIVDQQAANDAVNNNAPNEDAIAEADEREMKRQGKEAASKPAGVKASTAQTSKTPVGTPGAKAEDVHKTETEPGVKGVQVPSR